MRAGSTHHIAIAVADLAKVERFYVELLGLPCLRRWPAADGQGERSVWLSLGADSFLALERCARDAQGDGESRAFTDIAPGLHLVAFSIAASTRSAWRARLTQAGVPVVRETDFTLYVQDPEGNRVGLSHWPTPRAAEDEPAGPR